MDTDDSIVQNKPGPSTEVSAQNAQTLRLQPFWHANPRIWFLQAEVQFQLNKITSDNAKFNQIIGNLAPEVCETISDIMENQPKENKYEILKTALIDRNSMSEENQLEKLLDKTQTGDRRPSEVLREIKTLAGTKFSAALIKSLWLRKLPQFIHLALVPQEHKDVDELVKTADRLHEVTSHPESISEVHQSRRRTRTAPHSSSYNTSSATNASTSMEVRLDRLERALARLTNQSRSSSRNRRYSSRSRQRSNSRGFRNSGKCWYHRTHGNGARKCEQPCNFKPTHKPMDVENSHPNA